MSNFGESQQENLSGAFDEEEYLEQRFAEDFKKFVASHEEDYKAEQRDLPAHKRDGYAERMYEQADDLRKRLREEGI